MNGCPADHELPADPFIKVNLQELLYIQRLFRGMTYVVGRHLDAISECSSQGHTTPTFASLVGELTDVIYDGVESEPTDVAQNLVDVVICLDDYLSRDLSRAVTIDVPRDLKRRRS